MLASVCVLVWCQAMVGQTAIKTRHGYRFINHTHKPGDTHPQPGESARISVDVWAGKIRMSSSRENPGGMYEFNMPADADSAYVPPLADALRLMVQGDSATIFQPVDTLMRNFLPPKAQKEKEIRFEVVLREIVTKSAKAQAAQAAVLYANTIETRVQSTNTAYKAGSLNDRITQRPSGLKMMVEALGEGKPLKKGEAVQLHYFGILSDGTPFDNSYARREPLGVPAGVGQMIPGFDEGIMQLKHGGKAYLFIPAALGYGATGFGTNIPPDADLVFYIEIL